MGNSITGNPITGFVNNGSLVQVGSANHSDQWDYLTLGSPKKAWRIQISGDLPIDGKKDMSVSVYEGTIPLFSTIGTWKVQGQSSAGAVKKNWALSLVNPVTGNPLTVKIGDWLPLNRMVLKAYATDRTLMRDIVTTRLWRAMHGFPSGTLAPVSAYSYFDGRDCGTHTSARFSTDGFPVEVYHDGDFLGLYVLRTDSTADQYLMDTGNPRHVLIQPQHAHDFWSDGIYYDGEWEYTSPATVTDDTRAAYKRFMGWASACIRGDQDIRRTYGSYIDLDSFLDYILLCELTGSYDSMLNNFFMACWDASPTSGKWFLYPYDEDETFGIGILSGVLDMGTIGWVMKKGGLADQQPAFFDLVHDRFRPEIRQRWKTLRAGGVLDGRSFYAMLGGYSDLISPDRMAEDLRLWDLNGATGIGTGFWVSHNGLKNSISYIQDFFNTRLSWLDERLGYDDGM